MKTILLTGATSFIGSHLLRSLIKEYNVVILKRSFSHTKRIEDLLDKVKYYDIDKVELDLIFVENKIDTIIHVATNYGRNGIKPVILSNILLPLELLELAQKHNTKYFISTDSFYNTGTITYDYLTSYALSKKHMFEWLKLSSKDITIVNMKLEHVYGSGDNHMKFVSGMITKLSNNEPEIALTFGEQKRDFVYIDDVVKAYMLVLSNLDRLIYNFSEFEIGTGQFTTIKDFVTTIHTITNSKSKLLFGKHEYRKNEIMESKADVEPLFRFVNWKPNTSIEEGLNKTILSKKKELVT
ncbi:NAD-dependent epimerase/dehydratase family protein [bacterium]